MDVQAILALMKEMKQSGIETLAWQAEGQSLQLVRSQPVPAGAAGPAGAGVAGSSVSGAALAATDSAGNGEAAGGDGRDGTGANGSDPEKAAGSRLGEGRLVTSPVVGVFYAAASPDQDPFVAPGSTVEAGAPLGIIEAMKLMNEVASPCSGTVLEIHVENGQRVEYGQPLFVIKENRP